MSNTKEFIEELRKLCSKYGYVVGGGGNDKEFKLHIYKCPVPIKDKEDLNHA